MGTNSVIADSNCQAGSSGAACVAGSAVATVLGRSHEHDPPGLTFAVGSEGVALGAAGGSAAQHDFAFGFAGFSQHDFGSPAASGFEQQQPRVVFSTTVQAQDSRAHPPNLPGLSGPSTTATGTATTGVNWPMRARTATASRVVIRRVDNG